MNKIVKTIQAKKVGMERTREQNLSEKEVMLCQTVKSLAPPTKIKTAIRS